MHGLPLTFCPLRLFIRTDTFGLFIQCNVTLAIYLPTVVVAKWMTNSRKFYTHLSGSSWRDKFLELHGTKQRTCSNNVLNVTAEGD